MEVKQLYELVNQTKNETIGETFVLKEDLSNLADLGKEYSNMDRGFDNFTNKLVDKVALVKYVNRSYKGRAPKLLLEAWEYGAIEQKISMKNLPDVTENETWGLQDGASYDQGIFTQPKVSAKFFNGKKTFEVPISIATEQVKSAFNSADEMNGLVAMIFNQIDNALVVANDSLIMGTVRTLIAETLYNEYQGGNVTEKSTVKAVNILKEYNDEFAKKLTVKNCMKDPAFLKYASYKIRQVTKHLANMSKLFNIGGADRFTPNDKLNLILLDQFADASSIYLESDTYHNELVALPGYQTVSFWQGSGKDFSFDSCSKIDVKTPNNHDVSQTGILGIACDHDAMAVVNRNKRVTSAYNARGEFQNYWHKVDASYFIDTDENAVIFFVA